MYFAEIGMNTTQYTFFGDHVALEALEQTGDPLKELSEHIEWEPLVRAAEGIWRDGQEKKSGRGPKPWAAGIMLRALVLRRLYNLSDEQTEYQLRDRLSFLRFVGLGLGDDVPDSRTIWSYGERLAKAEGARKLFDVFNDQLAEKGLRVKEGVIVDATFVEVPRQRNSPQKNEMIKSGTVPPEWEAKPRKLAQKDREATWAKKGAETHFGYKDHVKVGRRTKLILDYTATTACTHDSTQMGELIKPGDRDAHADSAYAGAPITADLAAKGVRHHIHEKGARGRPLSASQRENNSIKSKVRARVEHVFAFMENSLGGIYHRCIGGTRNAYQIGMMNLCYNLCRCVQLETGRARIVA